MSWTYVDDGLPGDDIVCGAIEWGKPQYDVVKVYYAHGCWYWAECNEPIESEYAVIAWQPIVRPEPPGRIDEG